MAVSVLSKAFRRLKLFKKEIASVHYSTHQTIQTKLPENISSVLLCNEKSLSKLVETSVQFTPRKIDLPFNIKSEFPLNKIIECPLLPNFQIDEPMKRNNVDKSDISPQKIIEAPIMNNNIEKHAARLIVIRRKKMKKHKRRKLLKKMKFIFYKRKIAKKNANEKRFQAELQAMIRQAEQFNPETYIAEKLDILNRKRLPNKWRGVYLPEAMIKEFKKEREEKIAYKKRLQTYRLKLD